MFQMSAEEHRLPDGKCACFYELGRMSLHSRFKLHGIDRIIKHPQLYFLMKFFLVSGYVYLILVMFRITPTLINLTVLPRTFFSYFKIR